MRITVTIDDALMDQASELTGLQEPAALIRRAVETLVRLEAGKRLAALGGTDPDADAVRAGRQERGPAR
ncbi:MAG: type II toxin-antitoxin system VapB family antitoxin [Bifidobacteriaceae bacterium]|jgi:Arc/MetJ family transcription regulator|nr:type II toxin-antitoxin system VapB family antitoxin [Bifidobacteriaceae bacterium]